MKASKSPLFVLVTLSFVIVLLTGMRGGDDLGYMAAEPTVQRSGCCGSPITRLVVASLILNSLFLFGVYEIMDSRVGKAEQKISEAEEKFASLQVTADRLLTVFNQTEIVLGKIITEIPVVAGICIQAFRNCSRPALALPKP